MAFFPVEHWDAGAEEWDKTIENKDLPHYFYYFEADLYIQEVLKNARLALELGAGTCGSTVKHASPNLEIVAIDYSSAMLSLGRKKLRDAGKVSYVSLVVADVCNLPFKDESFDAVFSRGVALSYASNPSRFAEESYRTLRRERPIGVDFMNGLVAKKAKGQACCARFERVKGITYYVEQFNEDGKQKRVGYRLPESLRLPESERESVVFGGSQNKPEGLKLEGLPTSEWWAAFYTAPQARKLFRSTGFKGVRLYPLGCFTYRLKDRELYKFLRDNRDYFCRIQKELSKIFRLESAVHIFLTASKPNSE